MSSTGPAAPSAPLTRDAVLHEVEFLGTVEHALIIECLSVWYALGCDLGPDEGGSTTDGGSQAAGAARGLWRSEMFHLSGVADALFKAGRPAGVGRATSILSNPAARAISLDPPGLAELQQLVVREWAIAAAVDERYTKLAPAVTTAPVFDPGRESDLLAAMQSVIVDHGPVHVAAFAPVTDPLASLAPDAFLRATRRDSTDPFEQRLLATSDQGYRVVVAALQDQFSQGGVFSSLAVSAMHTLDGIGHLLVQRGLLPPFTAP